MYTFTTAIQDNMQSNTPAEKNDEAAGADENLAVFPSQASVAPDKAVSQARLAEEVDHKMGIREGLRIYYKAVLWSAFLSIAVIMEGYDALLLSSLFGLPAFTKGFGDQLPSGKYNISAKWQSAIPNSVKVGQFFGLFIAGWAADRFGFRKTTMATCVVTAALIFMQFFAPNIEVLLAAELLFGFPLGAFMTLTSVYAAEICPM